MSDYKPITGELRGAWIGQDVDTWMFDKELFGNLCDAIDAIHAQLERENAEMKAELDRVTGEQEDRRSCIYYDPKRNYCSWHDIDTDALVEPPKDADELPICAGDDVEWLNGTKRGRVTGIGVGERDGWVWVLMEGKSVSIALLASDLHHYVPDTWERIIEDALGSRWSAPNELSSDFTALVARCKKLAGEAE